MTVYWVPWGCGVATSITRQDLYPWLAALYVDEAARGKGWRVNYRIALKITPFTPDIPSFTSGLPAAILPSATAGITSVMGWNTRTKRCICIAIR